jgi:hypothetical protein
VTGGPHLEERDRAPVVVEVDHGSASSWDRPASMAFLVRVHRGEDSLIVAIGLSRDYAESLAERLGNLLA